MNTTVTMKDPVVIAQSGTANNLRVEVPAYNPHHGWGRFRMPKVFRLPGGDIGLTFSVSLDHYGDQGRLSPLFVSRDNGASWVEIDWPDNRGAETGFKGMGTFIAELFDGDFLAIPATNGLEVRPETLSAPAGQILDFAAPFKLYDTGHPLLRDWFAEFNGMRWSAQTKRWEPVKIPWGDHARQLAFVYDDKPQGIAGHWTQKFYFELPVVKGDGELFAADYWSIHRNVDGTPPSAWPSSLMVSRDNGRTWQWRSFIASDASASGVPNVHYMEPSLARNLRGELVSVIRNAVGPMLHTHSKDNGFTWSKPAQLAHLSSQGVFPQLLQLANGVMVLAYGRADRGIWISCSRDGGHSWEPSVNVTTDTGDIISCGYVSMVALDEKTFLLAYADVNLKNPAGENCKSIVVREITAK